MFLLKPNPKIALYLFSVALLMMSCGPKVSQNNTDTMISPDNSTTLVQNQNEFGFTLFDKINSSDTDKTNKLISPLSIYMDFGMLYNGASGETKKALGKVLNLKEGDIEYLNKAQAKILTDLPKIDSSVTVNMANAIWYRNSLTPKSKFLSVNQKYYKARIEGADFGNTQTVKDINQWVNENTQGKITSILDNITPGDVMFLLNAVYFKGDWKEGFNSKLTHNDIFHTSDGKKELPFMFIDHRFNYFENEKLQIAELPYGNDFFSMHVLSPSKKTSADQLITELNSNYFNSLVEKMQTTKIKLFLPKWEASYSADNLKEQLSDMGMKLAFENEADFSELFENESTKISQVKHKTYIKVDEKGTEAAAVTSIGMVTTSLPMPTTTEMKVDRPFVYLIQEKSTGAILFLGVVNDPSKE